MITGDPGFMLLIFLYFGLLAGLISDLENLETRVSDMTHPNQNLSYGFRASLLIFLSFSLLATLTFSGLRNFFEQIGLSVNLVSNFKQSDLFLVFLFFSFLTSGTDVVIKHSILRLLLWQEGRLPLRLVPWLEWLQRRRVMQRVGGSYHFIHKQLQEHLVQNQRPPAG